MNDSLANALEGATVVALATNIPGPLAAARLRSMGATVVKVEPPRGDALAFACPLWYEEIVEGMEVVKVDLRDANDRERFASLTARADILITAMRASALARAGLGPGDLRARYPRLCHVAVVGEGAPHADRAGHDLTYQAKAGLLAPPAMPRTVLADLAAAERAVSAALAALLGRERTGRGAHVEVPIVDAAVDFSAPLRHGLTSPDGTLGGALPLYAIYPAKDGWVAVAALEAHFIERLGAMLGTTQLDAAALQAAFSQRSSAEWERLAAECDVPLCSVA